MNYITLICSCNRYVLVIFKVCVSTVVGKMSAPLLIYNGLVGMWIGIWWKEMEPTEHDLYSLGINIYRIG